MPRAPSGDWWGCPRGMGGQPEELSGFWREAGPGELGVFFPQSSFLQERLFGVCFLGEVSVSLLWGCPWRIPALHPPSVPITAPFLLFFSFSHVRACSPANVKSLLFTYSSTKLQRMGLGDKFSILRHADGSSIFTQNQQQNRNATGKLKKKKKPTQKKTPRKKGKKKKDFV